MEVIFFLLMSSILQYIEDDLFVCVFWYIKLFRLFNAKFIFIQVNSSISKNSVKHKFTFWYSKIFLFQAIQFYQTDLIQTI